MYLLRAILAVEHMFNGNGLPLNYDKMPKCIYTHPEVASIGYNKESAEAKTLRPNHLK